MSSFNLNSRLLGPSEAKYPETMKKTRKASRKWLENIEKKMPGKHEGNISITTVFFGRLPEDGVKSCKTFAMDDEIVRLIE